MSTTSRSPGSAPWISMGPLSMWARVRSTSRTSLAESLLPSWASVHSRHSTRNSLPGCTKAALGMSGCQRLCPGTAWSRMDLDWSTLNTTSGMSGTFLAGLRLSGALALGCDLWAVGSGHAHQPRPGHQPTLARAGRAAGWWERPAYALDAPLIAVRARRWWIGAGCLLG